MKNWSKILVLVLTTVIAFCCLFVAIIGCTAIDETFYMAKTILLIFAFLALSAAAVLFCIWFYKYSSENKHKTIGFTSLGVLVLSIVFFILSFATVGSLNSKDLSACTPAEVVEYLQSQGYKFSADESASKYPIRSISPYNVKENIFMCKMMDSIIGDSYSWKKDKVNEKFADIKDITKNDTKDKEKQFAAYQRWLNSNGLTTQQIIDALDYYQTTVTEYKKLEKPTKQQKEPPHAQLISSYSGEVDKY